MMIKSCIWKTDATTDEEFAKYIRGRRKIFMLVSIIGILTVAVALLATTGTLGHTASFLSGLYAGFGGVATALGIIYWRQSSNILKDQARLRKTRLESQDERTAMISQKSMSRAALIMLALLYVGILVAGFINMTVFWTIYAIAILGLVVYIVVNMYYNNKY